MVRGAGAANERRTKCWKQQKFYANKEKFLYTTMNRTFGVLSDILTFFYLCRTVQSTQQVQSVTLQTQQMISSRDRADKHSKVQYEVHHSSKARFFFSRNRTFEGRLESIRTYAIPPIKVKQKGNK